MSAPSFKLGRRGKTWVATAVTPAGKRPITIECGDGSEAAARKIADREMKRRFQLAEASRTRWRQFHADKLKAATAAPEPDEDEDDLPDDLDEQLANQDAHDEEPTPIERPTPEPAPAPRRSPEELRAKLLSLGDAVKPDEVIPPGVRAAPVDEDPIDDETPQLVADVIAGLAVNWHVRAITKSLKKKKPPKTPGESDERMLQWEHDGIAYNMRKLVGKSVAMGPTGKMIVGALVVTAQMYLESETTENPAENEPPRDSASSPRENVENRARAAEPAPAAEEPKASAPLALVKNNPGVGTFK